MVVMACLETIRALALEQLVGIEERALKFERTLLEHYKVAARDRDTDGRAAGSVVLGRQRETLGPERVGRVPMPRRPYKQSHKLLHHATSRLDAD